jgi:carbon monoxide dehydrogenase subunit G
MGTRVEERFTVQAPVGATWALLVDPRRVVTCLPGAELTEVVDERTFHGNVKVKVGPVAVAYRGTVHLVELDQAAWRVRMAGEGREAGGAGSARMTMESRLAPAPGGRTEVVVVAEVDIAGRLVQLGRGMIEQVSHQIFLQFAESVRRTLEAEAVAPAGAVPPPPPPREAVRLLPLVLRALLAWLRSLLRRLTVGKG